MKRRPKARPGFIRRILFRVAAAVILFYGLIGGSLFALRLMNPPTTAVQTARRIQSWVNHTPYRKSYDPVSIERISPELQHAVIAAEDTRFYQHHGFDWDEIQVAIDDDLAGGRSRGASTITQQLVKNLFLTTGRSWIRKGVEFTIVPLAETLLSKRRILELYLNVIEWGPGVYGAEAAAERYYHVPAKAVTREQAIQLAAILPAPLRRKPGRMSGYGDVISERMSQMGW